MYKKIWIVVISVILILTFSGSIIAKEILSAKIELKDGSVITGEIEKLIISIKTKDGVKEVGIEDIVFLQMNIISSTSETLSASVLALDLPLYIIGGKSSVEGFRKFCLAIKKSFGRTSTLGGYPLIEGVEKHLKYIKGSNTIFLILPTIPEFKGLQKLMEKYPELLPLSYDKLDRLKSYVPLLYFSYDIQADKIRGIIIADKVDDLWVKLLAEKELLLDTLLQYKDGQLKEIKEK